MIAKFVLFNLILTFALSLSAIERVSNKLTVDRNYLSLELGGRGALYSLNYERRFSARTTLGFGFSHYSIQLDPSYSTAKIDSTIIPIYANYYFSKSGIVPFITSGVSVIDMRAQADVRIADLINGLALQLKNENDDSVGLTANSNLNQENSAHLTLPIPSLGMGIETRRSGALMRGQILFLYANSVIPWAGLSIGGGF